MNGRAPPDPATFAPRLRHLRIAAGLTQAQLAARSGLSTRGISDLERGLRAPRATTLGRLAEGLDVPLAALDDRLGPAAATVPDSDLAPPIGALIGRDEEIRAIHALLDTSHVRLVTITGAGGVGKTRVAFHVAHGRHQHHDADVVVVDLAPLVDPDLVVPAMARALGVPGVAGRQHLDRLHRALAHRQVLVVLDNVEHVIAAAADLPDLLARCPGLTILATSRERLRVSGEHEYPLAPLAVPDRAEVTSPRDMATIDAIALFVQRARAVQPDFTLTDVNADAIAAICCQLDGLPLAIELAASRVKVLPPAVLRDRIERLLPLLTGGNRDLPERQQTMRNTIAWSYNLLSPEEQRVFRQLAVFTGGFTLEAFEAVCVPLVGPDIPPVELLGSLVNKHLVQVQMGDHDRHRYGLLEPIREFGREALIDNGETDDARRTHAGWCLEFVETVAPTLRPILRPAVFQRIEAEHANLRAALTWLAHQGRTADLTRMASGLGWFWYLSGRWHDGLGWLEWALDHPPDTATPEYVQALISAGHLGLVVRDPGAQSRLDRGLALARATGDTRREVKAVILLGIMANYHGDHHHAETRFAEAKALLGSLDDPWDPIVVEFHLGATAYGQGRRDDAAKKLEVTKSAAQAIGDVLIPAWCAHFLTQIACEQGDIPLAASRLRAVRHASFTGGITQSYPQYLNTAAMFAHALGQHRSTARLLGAAAMAINDLAFPYPVRAAYDTAETFARDCLGSDHFDELWHAGRRMRRAELEGEIDQLLAIAERADNPTGASLLTPREQEVLQLLIEGRSNPEIAIALFISTHTAARHVTNILGKFGVETRAAAVAYAYQHKLV